MKNDDYGFYGKGLDGYVHYRQGKIGRAHV